MQHFKIMLTAGVFVAAVGTASAPAMADNGDPVLRLFNNLVTDGQRVLRGDYSAKRRNDDDDDGYRRSWNDDDDDDGGRGNDDDD